MKIDVGEWKEFRVGKLFEAITKTAKKNNYKKSKEPEGDYVIPALSSKAIDNSFGFYVKEKDHNLINVLCLSVTSNGNAGKVFIQNKPFAIAQDAYALMVRDYKVNLFVYFFLATILEERLINKYGFDEKATWNKVKKEIISLPAIYNVEKDDYEPDFDYMEEFIKTRENIVKEKVENFKNIKEKDSKIDIEEWGEFEVKRLFNILPLKGKLGRKEINNIGDTPVYSSDSQNYGLYRYTNEKARYIIDENNPFYITFGDHTRAFNFVFTDFAITDNVKVLSPKFGNNIKIALFILTMWSKDIPNLGYSRHWSVAKNVKIKLPVKNNEPDWEYMEQYIDKKQREAKEKVQLLRR